MVDRGTKNRQRRVTLELVHEAAVLVDGVDDDPEELVEHPYDHRRPPSGRQLGGPHQVDEEHRDAALLASQFGAVFERPARHVLADVAAEQVA
ncbi:Uncharacterised protein [Mycobacteroides abscessus subsp. abscessus]|nr:Uncharacterised protein [Mycobacteroides abscessus subsp. abscessus]